MIGSIERTPDPKSILHPEDKFDFVTPEKILLERPLDIIELGETKDDIKIELLQFPDLDGKLIWIARMILGGDQVREKLDEFGVKLEHKSLSQEQKERLLYCLVDLDLEIALAVHLALNKPDVSLDSYRRRGSSSVKRTMMVVTGEAGSGKSAILAALALQEKPNIDFYSLDAFSSNNWFAYLDYFHSHQLNKSSSPDQIITSVSDFRAEQRLAKQKSNLPVKKEPGYPLHRSCEGDTHEKEKAKTARTMLDELLAKSLSDDTGKLIIVEGVSSPSLPLSANILHLLNDSFETTLCIGPEKSATNQKFGLLANIVNDLLAKPYLWLESKGPGLSGQDLMELLDNFEYQKDIALELAARLKKDFIAQVGV